MTEHSTAKNFSRPLRSRFEGWPNCVTDGAEDDVDGIASATFEIAAAEMTLCLHMLPSAPPSWQGVMPIPNSSTAIVDR
jgi:hypothetical protein